MNKKKRIVIIVGAIVALVACLALLAWASTLNTDLIPRAAENWSRARVLGVTTVKRTPAIQPAPGEGVYLLWGNSEGRLQLVRVDAAGDVTLDRTLPLGTGTARDPQLQVDAEGMLHVLWRDELGGAAAIRYARLDAEGYTLGEPLELFQSTDWGIDAPQLVTDGTGRLHGFWVSGEGIEHAAIDPAAGLLAEPELLIPGGGLPSVQAGSDGLIHLACWQRVGVNGNGLYVATYDPAAGELGEVWELTTLFLRTGQRLEGPAIDLAGNTTYVFWSIEDRRDVSSASYYAFFPTGRPELVRVEPLNLYLGWNPSAVSPLAGSQQTPRMALSATTLASEQGILLEAIFEQQGSIAGAVSQLMVVDLVNGETAEQVITASPQAIVKPALVVANEYLHATGLQVAGAELYRVVYASNAPAVMQSYNAITLFDVVNTVFNVIMQSALLVLTVIPMLLLWAAVPMLLLSVYHWFSGDEELDRLRSRLALSLTIGLEIILTVAFPLRVELAWPPLRWVGPLATAALAGMLTWLILRRKDQNLLFLSFLTFAGLHILLLWLTYLVF